MKNNFRFYHLIPWGLFKKIFLTAESAKQAQSMQS
jgi:hypothetical protein